MLWLPSHIWFEFLAQRLKALKEQQEQLQALQPANYGLLTGLHQFLMQSIIFTPPITETFVRNALYILRYRANIAQQGMFFLHELDLTLESCHPELPEKDDLLIIQRIGVPLQERRKTFTAIQQAQRDVDRYPLGSKPSWRLVTETIQHTPWILMQRWEWPQELEDLDVTNYLEGFAAHIFVKFTQSMWTALHDTWNTSDVDEQGGLQSLNDAMNIWSLESIYKKIIKCQFMACNANLGGAVHGRRHMAFRNRMTIYFPKQEDDVSLPGLWITMAQEPGYIFEYWEWCNGHREADVIAVDDILGTIFSYCQCLPSSRRDEAGGQPWEVLQGSIKILTNPNTYKMDAIGTGQSQHKKSRSAPAVRTKGSMMQKLMQQHGVGRQQLQQAQYIQRLGRKKASRTSSKARNKRVPPKRKGSRQKVAQNASDECDDEGEMDEADDEDEDEDVDVDVDVDKDEDL